jgi:hypothetical protein
VRKLQRKTVITHVVVNIGRPARRNLHTGVAIRGDGAHQRPHLVHLIHQNRTSIVTNNVNDGCCNPCTDCVAIVKTCNSRRDKSFGTELCCTCDADLFKPCLIPSQFLVNIEIGRIILILMCESVRDMRKGVQVRRLCPPGLEGIKIGACRGVWICLWGRRPEIDTGIDRFHKFECGVDLIRIFDGTDSTCCPGLVDVFGILDMVSVTLYSHENQAVTYFDIAIAIVANFHKVVASCW